MRTVARKMAWVLLAVCVVAARATVGGQQIVREMYPTNSFRSQPPSIAHFGLGDLTQLESLAIRWP